MDISDLVIPVAVALPGFCVILSNCVKTSRIHRLDPEKVAEAKQQFGGSKALYP